jgi:hypothetical protein
MMAAWRLDASLRLALHQRASYASCERARKDAGARMLMLLLARFDFSAETRLSLAMPGFKVRKVLKHLMHRFVITAFRQFEELSNADQALHLPAADFHVHLKRFVQIDRGRGCTHV